MVLKTDLYIDGEWISGTGSLPVYDPSNGEIIAHVATADDSQCEAAIDAAYRAFRPWAKTAPRLRSEILRKAFEIMVSEADQIAELISKENGKIFSDARGDRALTRPHRRLACCTDS
jgi:succinate-semialdehyde dehydrogenase/glutarate-semialdehyde dehydrogenase